MTIANQLKLMVFDNFWYIIGSIFGLTIPFLISLYELLKVNFEFKQKL